MGLKQKEEAIINLVINGQQAKASLKEITGSYNALTAEIRSMKKADDPAAYEHKIKVLDRLRTTLSSVKDEVNGGTKALAKWKTELAAVATGVIGGNIITSISEKLLSFIPNMINSSAELSDQLSDIQKTTGMSEGAVDRLNAKLSKIDTRTKTKELRDIAINAGQLGIAKDDVLGFTTAVDKANVALGDEFDGGAGEVSNTLGKLRNVLLDVKSDHIETDILHIGNALNVLGAEGLATSPVVADFAGRIGGVGIQMGLTSGQVLGLSATMQELNISTERGSTAVITILQRMLTNYKDFAKVAGLSAKDFKKLADNDLYGAFMKVVDGANRSKESSTGFAKLLDKLKIDGAGASEVISKLGGSQDLLTSRVGSATEALKGQSSIINEFNLKNNNLAANWEKLSKRFSTMWNSSAMKSFFSDVIGYMAGSETAAQKAEKKFYDLKEQVDSLTSTMPPLLDRYDQLKAKTMLNKDEHTELKTIIDKVTSVIPGLATEVDKYGHIMSMSTTEARNFIEVQKNLLQYQNQDAIKRTTKDLEEYKEKLRHFRTELATGWTEDAINKYFTGNNKGLKLTQPMRQNITEQAAYYATMVQGAEAALKKLKGLDIPEPKVIKPTATPDAGKTTALSLGDDEEDKIQKKREEALERSKQLSLQYKEFTAGELADLMAKNDKEVRETELRFDKMIADETNFLSNKETKEYLSEKEIQKHRDEAAKLRTQKSAALLSLLERQEKDMLMAVDKLRTEMTNRHLSETQKEYDKINELFDKQKADAGTNEEQLALVEENRAKALAEAKIRAEQRLQKEIEQIRTEGLVTDAELDKIELAKINKKYDDRLEALKESYKAELGETQAYLLAKKLIEQNREGEIDQYNKKKKKKTADEEAEDDRKKKEALINGAESIANAYFDIAKQNRDAELDATISSLEKEREATLATKGKTEKEKKKINDEYDAKIKAEKLKAWKADKQAAIEQAIIAGALAVVKALPNPFAAIAAGVAASAQVAVMVARKPPQFYTGVRSAEEGFAWVGERGPELIEEDGMLRLADHEQLTHLKEGANVYNAGETADILSGIGTRSAAKAAFQKMTRTAAGVTFDSQAFTQGVDQYRYGPSSTTGAPSATGQLSQPPVDLAPLMQKFDEMIIAQQAANDKEVLFVYREYEKFQNKIVKARYDAGN